MITTLLAWADALLTADTLLWVSIYLLAFVVLVALFGRASDPAQRMADDLAQLEAISRPAPLQPEPHVSAAPVAVARSDGQIIRHAFVQARRRASAEPTEGQRT